MNKAKEVQDKNYIILSSNPLIQRDYIYVMVSHQELDNLVARLMHLAELDSDKEHRDALKGELKQIARAWLDNLYHESGYRNYETIPQATVVTVEAVENYQ